MARKDQDVEEIAVDTTYCSEESSILHPSQDSVPNQRDRNDHEATRRSLIPRKPQLTTSPNIRKKLTRTGPMMDLLRAFVLLFILTIIGGVLMGLYYHRRISKLHSEYERLLEDFNQMNRSVDMSSGFGDSENKIGATRNDSGQDNLVGHSANLSLIMKFHQENLWLNAFIRSTISKENLVRNLFLAINEKQIPAIPRLIALGADVNGASNLSQRPLHRAALSSDKYFALNAIRILIENGADPFATDKEGFTFLHRLVEGGTTTTFKPQQFRDLVEFLISKNISHLFNTFSKSSPPVTPMQLALKNLEIQTGTVDLLKRNGVDFNQVDGQGNSLLFYSIEGLRSPAFLSDIIALGTNPNHLNIRKRGVLHWTAKYGNVEQLKFFLTSPRLGTDINSLDVYGNTPLLTLVQSKNTNALEMTRLLLYMGAEVRIENWVGESALNMAVENKYLVDKDEVLELLRNGR